MITKIKYITLLLLIIPGFGYGLEISDSKIRQIENVIRSDFETATGYDIDHKLIIDRDMKNRGGATSTYIKINPSNMKSKYELYMVIAHELAHALQYSMNGVSYYSLNYTDFGNRIYTVDNPYIDFVRICWESEHKSKCSNGWDYPTRYGQKNMHEDFAESVTQYLFARDMMTEHTKHSDEMQKKYEFIEDLFDGWYYSKGKSDRAYRDENKYWITALLYD